MYDVLSRVVVLDVLLFHGVSGGVVMGGRCCLIDWVCLHCICALGEVVPELTSRHAVTHDVCIKWVVSWY